MKSLKILLVSIIVIVYALLVIGGCIMGFEVIEYQTIKLLNIYEYRNYIKFSVLGELMVMISGYIIIIMLLSALTFGIISDILEG